MSDYANRRNFPVDHHFTRQQSNAVAAIMSEFDVHQSIEDLDDEDANIFANAILKIARERGIWSSGENDRQIAYRVLNYAQSLDETTKEAIVNV